MAAPTLFAGLTAENVMPPKTQMRPNIATAMTAPDFIPILPESVALIAT